LTVFSVNAVIAGAHAGFTVALSTRRATGSTFASGSFAIESSVDDNALGEIAMRSASWPASALWARGSNAAMRQRVKKSSIFFRTARSASAADSVVSTSTRAASGASSEAALVSTFLKKPSTGDAGDGLFLLREEC